MIKNNSGFTYIGLLFIIVVMGINLMLAGTLYSFAQQREKERQLIFVGEQFRQAIKRYYIDSSGKYPPTLDSLLSSDGLGKVSSGKKYLRKIYLDPFTKSHNWGIVKSPQDGGVMGVYSLSKQASLKYANFDLKNLALENKKYYKDWHFVFTPVHNQANAPKVN